MLGRRHSNSAPALLTEPRFLKSGTYPAALHHGFAGAVVGAGFSDDLGCYYGMDSCEAPCNPSRILTQDQFNLLWQWLPARFMVNEPRLVYATVEDGCSLKRLYDTCEGCSPLVLVVKSAEKNLFGVYISEPLELRGRFYGSGEDFLFTIAPSAVKYGWSRQNRYYMLVERTQLACGSG
eukprot:TRINITY_DN4901_c0_g2_i6.p1 TRINITY_DN4901_c0_g2~~TRINITY_DN4901_c0_g2_i6.p1  ORF type:complete len:194 (+),score=44.52 TRINITY_DN4901_c0_g2_i6:48-584(+)